MKTWKTLNEQSVFSAQPYLEVLRQVVETETGVVLDDFYQVRLRSFVVCVPVLENGNILVIRQYKHGPGRVSLTFPGGFVESSEPPAVACHRELLEETGLKGKKTVHLGEFVDNGNQYGCCGNYYTVSGCRTIQSPRSGDIEQMVLEEKTVQEIDVAVFDGDIAIAHHAAVWSLARLKGLN